MILIGYDELYYILSIFGNGFIINIFYIVFKGYENYYYVKKKKRIWIIMFDVLVNNLMY